MTVALGILCSDGVVLASDSMGTAGMRASMAQKVHCLDKLPVAWTAAGAVYTIEEGESALRSLDIQVFDDEATRLRWLSPERQLIRQILATSLRGAMRDCYNSMLSGMQPAADFLVGGWSSNQGWLLEVAGDGQLNWHNDTKFYAVGTGGDFANVAQGLMAHYFEGDDLDVDNGLRVAYRAIETTCNVSSQWVGLPVQLGTVTSAGAAVLTREEVDAVGTAVDRWKKLERDTLLQLKEGGVVPLPLDAEPLPQIDDEASPSSQ